jgi:N-terminal domain of toast_rack, DUF2154
MRFLTLAPFLACLAACGRSAPQLAQREPTEYRETVDGTGAKEVKAAIHMGGGKLRIGSGAAKLLSAEFRTTGDKPKVRYDSGERGRLVIEQGSMSLGGNNGENDWDLQLGGGTAMDLEVEFGAGEADIDLADLKLRNLVIHMGAGKLNLDLRGAYAANVNVEIHGGVGEARIRLPKKMRIEAEVHGGLGEIEAHGLDHEGDRYVSRNAAPEPRMQMEVHGGIGRIELDAQ